MIHLVGYRRSYPVASHLAYALEKVGVPSFLHTGVGLFATGHALRPGDAVLAITFAPCGAETLAFVAAARDAGLPVVAITDSLSVPLERLGVLPLLVSEVDVGGFRALSATFALATALAVAIGARREGGAEFAVS